MNFGQLAYSQAETLDLIELIHDRRDVCRISFEAGEDYNHLLHALNELKLVYLIDRRPFKTTGLYGSQDDSWSQQDDVDIYISKTHDLLEHMLLLISSNQHELIGKHFGYPDCCVQSFLKGLESQHTEMPLLSCAIASAVQNNTFRFLKILSPQIPGNTLSFFPCRFDCKSAVEKASWRASHRQEIFHEDPSPTKLVLKNNITIDFDL